MIQEEGGGGGGGGQGVGQAASHGAGGQGFTSRKKTWGELREDVRSIRRRLWSLGFRLPHSFSFRAVGSSTRVYFMCSAPNNRDNSVYAIDIPDFAVGMPCRVHARGAERGEEQVPLNHHPVYSSLAYPWIQILPTGFQGLPLSKAELLMLERKRMSPTGISAYDFHSPSGKFVFTASSSIFQCTDNQQEYPLSPQEIRSEGTSGARLNARICPHNPNLIAFVNNGDLWVVNSESGTATATRLTHTATAQRSGTSSEDEPSPISAGLPSYIMQEEFNRFDGFWWQPLKGQCSDSNANDLRYRILYEEVDEGEVNVVSLLTLPGREPEKYRFPTPGSPNAISRLRLVSFGLDVGGEVVGIKREELPFPLKQHFPWVEYIVRIGWTPDGDFVWTELLDRAQRRLEIVLFPLIPSSGGQVPSAPAYVILTEESGVWINVHDLLAFLPSQGQGPEAAIDPSITFLWASEESGFRHLYLLTSKLRPALGPPWSPANKDPALFLSPQVIRRVQLTSGPWEVLNVPLALHLQSQTLFFMGHKDSPLERHLYSVSLDLKGQVGGPVGTQRSMTSIQDCKRLTTPGYSFSAAFNDEVTLLILTYSNVSNQPLTLVHRIVYEEGTGQVTLQPLTYLTEPKSMDPALSFPEIHCYKRDSEPDLYAMIYKPFDFDPRKKYPAVLNVYGGPEVQIVLNSFRGTGQLWLYLMAAQGYCVIAIDSRGSHHRGLEFESHIHRRMGTVEMADQVEVLTWLASQEPYVDLSRVGIYGWSYGGYLALMGLTQYPSLFKVCIAGAPVTSWELYDSGYTERYMDLPEKNPSGYKQGSVLSHVHLFPDEPGRVLLVHGLNDENVHFTHTAELVNGLIRVGKPYSLQLYPGERHSLRRLDASEHYETVLLSFLQDKLK